MAAPKLRFGISGCGRRGKAALQSASEQHDCVAHAVHDPDAAAAAALAQAHGLTRHDTFEGMLGSGIDFVVLAGPFGERLRHVEAAAEQGVHCLLHAPIAADAATASAMLRACDEAGVKLGVAVASQAEPTMEQLRRMVADDWLGAPTLVQALCADDCALRDPARHGRWVGSEGNASGSPLVHFAAESLHLAIWLCEREPVAAVAIGAPGITSLAHENAAAAVMLRGGAVCSFSASHAAQGSSFAVHGTDGAIRIDQDRVWLRGRKAFFGDSFSYAHAGHEQTLPRTMLQDPLARHFELHGRFARWIDDRDDFPCPGEQAVRDMRALDAAQRALASRRVEDVTT